MNRVARAVLFALFALSPCLLYCSAPQTCVRISDCDDGYTCQKGACVLADPTAAEAGVSSIPDASKDAAEASTSSSDASAGVSDAGDDGEASVDDDAAAADDATTD